jgi:RNA-dependent RNA polymerase
MEKDMLELLRKCANKLRLLAVEDPQINLMARTAPRWELVKLTPDQQGQMFNPPDLSQVRFRTRCLVEGLIGLGILKPGDVPELLQALRRHAVAPAFQERLLEDLFKLKEDRIRNVARIVAGKLAFALGGQS